MKLIQKTKIIPEHAHTYDVYVAEDGTEFRTKLECLTYERKQFCKNHPVLKSEQTGLFSFYEDLPAKLYFISNEDDLIFLLDYLEKIDGPSQFYNDFDKFFCGWYIYYTIGFNDACSDSYLINYDNYINNIKGHLEDFEEKVAKKISSYNIP